MWDLKHAIALQCIQSYAFKLEWNVIPPQHICWNQMLVPDVLKLLISWEYHTDSHSRLHTIVQVMEKTPVGSSIDKHGDVERNQWRKRENMVSQIISPYNRGEQKRLSECRISQSLRQLGFKSRRSNPELLLSPKTGNWGHCSFLNSTCSYVLISTLLYLTWCCGGGGGVVTK